ncbi:cytosine permease [Glutamicibacter sp. ZJUTW]|uniref:purine-cytosine permease family protein n=1 Tax=Glutamicibacter sp. ZJUTW TaxID=1155384 RepID=UPI0011F31E30|nr:cytosine permease [Glutamicibacter sp. ZJUTW]QEP08344.1 transporter [Glutamicibacter sp. ZJUTW]
MLEQDNPTPAYGASLTKAEPYATEQIPDAERHGHPRSQFTLWFAANMVLAVMVSGFFSSLFGLSVAQGLSAVAVGTLLGVVVMGVLAGIGTKLGVPQQVQGRGPMGFYGNFLPITLLTIVSAIGWTAVNTVFAVIALQMLVNVPFTLAAVAIFAVQSVFAIWGHNLVHLVNKIATVVLTVLFVIISVLSLGRADFSVGIDTSAPLYMGGMGGWVTFAGFFFAYVMTWTPFASDFSRYLPRSTSHAKVVGYTAAGSFIAMAWLGSIGVLVSSFAGELDAIPALAELTGSWAPVAMLTVVLSTIPVSAMNLYGGSLSLLTVKIPVSRIVGVIIVAVASLGMTLLMQTNPYGGFYDFLSLLAYLVVPFSAVLLLDYYLRMRKNIASSVAELFNTGRRVEWGFFAWIIGCLVSSLFWNTSLIVGPFASTSALFGDLGFVAGIVAATVAYMAMCRLAPLPGMRATERPGISELRVDLEKKVNK